MDVMKTTFIGLVLKLAIIPVEVEKWHHF